MRTWDMYNNQDRYWYNIPAMIVVNSVVYPDAKIKVHISDEIRNNPKFEVLEAISNKMTNVELVYMPYDYRDTEPTMWRYKPLFDKEADIVLCRDIDSVPNEDEIRASLFFINEKQFYTHTLRTHTNHIIPHTIMLAGLCGFRPKKVDFIQNINFEMYYNHFKNGSWGLDQSSLINMFVQNPNWTKQRFLDSPISTQYHKVGKPLIQCESLDQDLYKKKIDLSHLNSSMLQIINDETKWAGEPTNLRGEKLKKLLELDIPQMKIMKDIIGDCSEEIKIFYYNV